MGILRLVLTSTVVLLWVVPGADETGLRGEESGAAPSDDDGPVWPFSEFFEGNAPKEVWPQMTVDHKQIDLDERSRLALLKALQDPNTKVIWLGPGLVPPDLTLATVSLRGDVYTLDVHLGAEGGLTIGTVYPRYRVFSPPLAEAMEHVLERNGLFKTYRGRCLQHWLRVEQGKPSEYPQPTPEEQVAMAREEKRRSFSYRMTPKEARMLKEVDAFLKGGGDVNARDEDGRTRLHQAAEEGYRFVVEHLLLRGAAPDARRKHGGTPLMEACMGGHRGCAAVLIIGGADVNATSASGATPLFWAARGTLSLELDPQRVELVEMLIQARANVNASTTAGDTPLHGAAGQGWREVVELLLAAGADPTAKNNQGQTALGVARSYRRKAVVALLESHDTKQKEAGGKP